MLPVTIYYFVKMFFGFFCFTSLFGIFFVVLFIIFFVTSLVTAHSNVKRKGGKLWAGILIENERNPATAEESSDDDDRETSEESLTERRKGKTVSNHSRHSDKH